jgi:hypothetical protein
MQALCPLLKYWFGTNSGIFRAPVLARTKKRALPPSLARRRRQQSAGASGEEIGSVISNVPQEFDTLLPLVNKKPGRIGKSAYTLGDEVGILPCSENSDILIFVQGQGQVLTENRATMTFLIGGPAENAEVLVTMADAKTGEIIGLIQMYPDGSGFLDSAEDAFGEQLDNELAIMNIGSARKNAKARGD